MHVVVNRMQARGTRVWMRQRSYILHLDVLSSSYLIIIYISMHVVSTHGA